MPNANPAVEFALQSNGFDCNQVGPKVYMGSFFRGTPEQFQCLKIAGFGVVAFLAEEQQPRVSAFHNALAAGLTPVAARLDDCLDECAVRQLRPAMLAADKIATRMAANGNRALITCAAGVNRSGLVAAIVLWMRGMPIELAISEIQRLRQPSLVNQDFVAMLVSSFSGKSPA